MIMFEYRGIKSSMFVNVNDKKYFCLAQGLRKQDDHFIDKIIFLNFNNYGM